MLSDANWLNEFCLSATIKSFLIEVIHMYIFYKSIICFTEFYLSVKKELAYISINIFDFNLIEVIFKNVF